MKHLHHHLCSLVVTTAVISCGGCRGVQLATPQSPASAPSTPTMAGADDAIVSDHMTGLRVYYAYSRAFGDYTMIGYLDEEHRVFYAWKNVRIPSALIPEYDMISPGARILNLDEDSKSGVKKVATCDPPVRLIKVGDDKAGIAYVDRSHARFYRWKRIQFDAKVITGDGIIPLEILDPKAMKFRIIEIDAPKFAPDSR
jgi:hypothetical protein